MYEFTLFFHMNFHIIFQSRIVLLDNTLTSVHQFFFHTDVHFTEERKLGLEEKPLLVQLNWHIDDREGRFLLRRIDDKTNAQGVGFAEGTSFRRKLSKREKKQIKKQEKLSRLKSVEQDENTVPVDQNGVAEKLYTGKYTIFFHFILSKRFT